MKPAFAFVPLFLGICLLFPLAYGEAPAERNKPPTSADACREFALAMGEPRAPCYCPPQTETCVLRLDRWLVEAHCGNGWCAVREMAGAAP